ncbi:MAG: HIRAN domain-containing protein [Cardiobacteriaceae bacterium]|nr:HIRAN domain-containing protein [Cardiobacteriaceae bacterium]
MILNILKKWFRRMPRPVVAQVPVAGLAYYRAEDLAALMHRGDFLDLRHEPDNPHDANAIMILWHNNKIGYVPGNYARDLQGLFVRDDSVCGKIVDIDPQSDEHRWVKFNIYPRRHRV